MDNYQIALKYVELGLSIIPLYPEKKEPFVSWIDYQKKKPNRNEIKAWFAKYPNAGVGILCGTINKLCVVDVDDPSELDWCLSFFSQPELISKTPKGYHLFYNTGDRIIKRMIRFQGKKIDILGEGSYVAVYPTINGRQTPYLWQPSFDFFPENLKLLQQAETSFDFEKLQFKSLSPSPISIKSEKEQPASIGSRNTTLASIVGKWFAMGVSYQNIAMKAMEWNSRCDPPLSSQEVERTIKSIHKINEQKKRAILPDDPVIPEEQIVIKTLRKFEAPLHLISGAGPLIMDIIDHIDKISACAHPWFSLAATISFLGSILGQKVQTETGLRTNIYAVAVGRSGAGKNAPFAKLPGLIEGTEAAVIVGPDNLASGAAIMSWLNHENNRNTWLRLDEISYLFDSFSRPNSPTYSAGELFTKFFSNTDSPAHKIYANRNDSIFLPWSHLGFYGATTPKALWNNITAAQVSNGFMARLLIFESDHLPIKPKFPKTSVSDAITAALVELYKMPLAYTRKLIRDTYYEIPTPIIIPKTKEAAEYSDMKMTQYYEKRLDVVHHNYDIGSIYGRTAEHASKIALIHTMVNDPIAKRVSLDSIRWAWDLVEYIVDHTCYNIKMNISENETDKWKNKILMGIGEKGRLSLREIQRNFARGLTVPKLTEYMDSLILAGEVKLSEIKTKNGKKVPMYILS